MTRSERLLLEAAALLQVYASQDHYAQAWLKEARAYIAWTKRPEAPIGCDLCEHGEHIGEVCGAPRGNCPDYKTCMCGSEEV